MCGIAGIYAYHTAATIVDPSEIARISDRMAPRGPDGKGAWVSVDGRIGLGHRRLSIIDLSQAASQPMSSADGKHVVTFNGEIYNFRILRQLLEKKGCVFRTQSDTEVLLHLYANEGDAMVRHLRGMFAFGLWDAEKRALLLARDHYGIKPLYYAVDNGTLRFASQVKALLAGGRISRAVEPAGWVGFYLFGSVPEPYTIYRQIRAVPAGTTLWVDSAGVHEPKRYFSVAQVYRQVESCPRRPSGLELRHEIADALLESVRHHLVADVPVGAFLSAGVDSGALTGLMRDAGQDDIQTVTITFEEFRGKHCDEAPLAESVARHYGTRHTTRLVTQREFMDDLPRILEAMDQPSVDGVNTWFVSKAARELGLKVAVSGLGGDELLGGYSTFLHLPRRVRILAVPACMPGSGRAFRRLMTRIAAIAPGVHPKIAGLLELGGSYAGSYLLHRGLFLPWELPAVLEDRDLVRDGLTRLQPINLIREVLTPAPRAAFGKVAALESSLYMRNQLLRDTDWTSMAHSVEVRVPFVDARLLQRIAPFTGTIPFGSAKAYLSVSPKTALPPSILNRRKTGFGIPLEAWLARAPIVQEWKRIPSLATRDCPWARRWAYQIAAA
jgi:asparagine synthase (glutamine-hydrolysing)